MNVFIYNIFAYDLMISYQCILNYKGLFIISRFSIVEQYTIYKPTIHMFIPSFNHSYPDCLYTSYIFCKCSNHSLAKSYCLLFKMSYVHLQAIYLNITAAGAACQRPAWLHSSWPRQGWCTQLPVPAEVIPDFKVPEIRRQRCHRCRSRPRRFRTRVRHRPSSEPWHKNRWKTKQNKNIFNWVSLTMQVTFCSLERRNKKWNGKEIVTNPSNHLTNQKIVVREFFFSFVRSYVRLLSANETSSQIEIAFFTPLWEKNARYQNKNVCETFLLEKCYNFTIIIKVQNVQVTT